MQLKVIRSIKSKFSDALYCKPGLVIFSDKSLKQGQFGYYIEDRGFYIYDMNKYFDGRIVEDTMYYIKNTMELLKLSRTSDFHEAVDVEDLEYNVRKLEVTDESFQLMLDNMYNSVETTITLKPKYFEVATEGTMWDMQNMQYKISKHGNEEIKPGVLNKELGYYNDNINLVVKGSQLDLNTVMSYELGNYIYDTVNTSKQGYFNRILGDILIVTKGVSMSTYNIYYKKDKYNNGIDVVVLEDAPDNLEAKEVLDLIKQEYGITYSAVAIEYIEVPDKPKYLYYINTTLNLSIDGTIDYLEGNLELNNEQQEAVEKLHKSIDFYVSEVENIEGIHNRKICKQVYKSHLLTSAGVVELPYYVLEPGSTVKTTHVMYENF